MPTYTTEPAGVQLAEAYKEAMAVAPIGRAVLYLLEVYHPALDEPLRFALNHEDVTATLEADAPRDAGQAVLHVSLPLGFKLPDQSTDAKAPAVQLWIDGVSALVTEQLDATVDGLDETEIILRTYSGDDLSGPAVLPPHRMPLVSSEVDEGRVTCTAQHADPANDAFPAKTFTRREYPALGG